MSGFLRHIHTCTHHDPAQFVPFFVGGKHVGFVLHERAELLPKIDSSFSTTENGVALRPARDDFENRSAALTRATTALLERFQMTPCHEMYQVVEKWGDAPLAELDRVAVPWFGVRGFGVHVNGFVRKPDGLHVWIGERAADRQIDPGKLDNLIGGGISIGHSETETLVKEAWEEAGIDADLAQTATAAGIYSYKIERYRGLMNSSLFTFDLELPQDFIPRNTDGEVASFTLMPIADVAAIIHDTDRFKFNCNLVIIDFMLRHGFIGPEHEEYAALAEALKPIKL
ncbi:MAG: DUF4743 domain-containing protein [Alphaproteobacteria bacterium]|nr:DUF4743 domain-containing protein [Alphaproteobacteria bacterium]